MDNLFKLANVKINKEKAPPKATNSIKKLPWLWITVLGLIIILCGGAELFMNHNPQYLSLTNASVPPSREFYFGTDTLGRDIFSMILYGGRISILIGIIATVISTFIAFIYGTVSGMIGGAFDSLLMRFLEILLSIPSLLLVIFLQGIYGDASIISISIVIGLTGWMSTAKIVRTEVKKIRGEDFVCASKLVGGGFFHILIKHLMPNFLPSVMFMVVMNISWAIGAEASLSFLGLGLPAEIISWGSMLSLSQNALLTGAWWVIVFPGVFLVLTMLSVANIGNFLRSSLNHKSSNI